MQENVPEPTIAPLVKWGATNGIPRTTCFELQRKGLLETVRIGKQTFVVLESARSLPERLRKLQEAA